MKITSIFNPLLTLLKGPLFAQAGVYMVVGFVGPLLGFLFMPLFTRVLSPEDYGLASMFSVLCGILASFVGINTHGAVARKYIEKESVDFPLYLSNCIFILFISSVIASFFIWFFHNQIAIYTHFPASWLWLVVLFAVGQHLIRLLQTLFQMQQKPFRYATVSLLATVSSVLLSLFLVVGLGMDWRGRIVSKAIPIVFLSFGVILFFLKTGYLKFKLNKKYIKHALNFGVPLIPHALGMYLISMTDRLLIVNMVGLKDLGIYSVGAQVGMIVGMCQSGFSQAWLPVFYKKLKQNSVTTNRKVVKFIYLYDTILLLGALGFGLLCIPLFKYVLGDRFSGAGIYVVWIMVGYAFNGMYKMSGGFLFYAEKTKYLPFITAFTAIVNVIFSYWLIKMNGSIGAAQGTMLAYLISFILTASIAGKVYKMPWKLWKKNIT